MPTKIGNMKEFNIVRGSGVKGDATPEEVGIKHHRRDEVRQEPRTHVVRNYAQG